MRHHYCGLFLYWLHHLSTKVPYSCGIVFGALQMIDDDTDAGGDFFFDLLKVLLALFVFILFVTVMGGIVWGLIA
jgi:hypothetical protein